MTDKRFRVKRWDRYEAIMCDNGKMINEEEAVDLLNEQHETIQVLQSFIKRLTNDCGEIVLANGYVYNVKKALGDVK